MLHLGKLQCIIAQWILFTPGIRVSVVWLTDEAHGLLLKLDQRMQWV